MEKEQLRNEKVNITYERTRKKGEETLPQAYKFDSFHFYPLDQILFQNSHCALLDLTFQVPLLCSRPS